MLRLKGALEIGVVKALERSLVQYPTAKGLILDSEGGNVYQARGLAKVILEHALDTYSYSGCYSACTIAYIAGENRYLGPAAELGFHAYRVDSHLTDSLVHIRQEQAKDLSFFESKISDVAFTNNIFAYEQPSIWIPTTNELLRAGVVHRVLNSERK